MEIILLLNRGAPEFYPKEFSLTKHEDFFRNGYGLCWFDSIGNAPSLLNADKKSDDFIGKIKSSGSLLVYDGIDGEPVNYDLIKDVLLKAIPQKSNVYICCHANSKSESRWKEKLENEFGDRLLGWFPFRNSGADSLGDIIFEYFKGTVPFDKLRNYLFLLRKESTYTKYIEILRLTVFQAREDRTTSEIKKIIRQETHLSVEHHTELLSLVKEVDKNPYDDSKWSGLFDFLDGLEIFI